MNKQLTVNTSKGYGWKDFTNSYLETVSKELTPKSVILDAGCGERGIYSRSKFNTTIIRKKLIGVDMGDSPNPYVDKKYVANLENLPFKDEKFDIIICEMVVEHLKYPEKVFKEFYRVCKKGGKIIIITPNIRNILVLFSKLIPNFLKDFLLKRLYSERQEDLFPIYMRCNSINRMNKITYDAGFTKSNILTYCNLDYYRFNPVIYRFILYLHKHISSIPMINTYRMYICATYLKQ